MYPLILATNLCPLCKTWTCSDATRKKYVVSCSFFLTRSLAFLLQITRQQYQNALTASRMDSSPQSPDIEVFCDGESAKVTKYQRVSESPKEDTVTTLLSDRNCNLGKICHLQLIHLWYVSAYTNVKFCSSQNEKLIIRMLTRSTAYLSEARILHPGIPCTGLFCWVIYWCRNPFFFLPVC